MNSDLAIIAPLGIDRLIIVRPPNRRGGKRPWRLAVDADVREVHSDHEWVAPFNRANHIDTVTPRAFVVTVDYLDAWISGTPIDDEPMTVPPPRSTVVHSVRYRGEAVKIRTRRTVPTGIWIRLLSPTVEAQSRRLPVEAEFDLLRRVRARQVRKATRN